MLYIGYNTICGEYMSVGVPSRAFKKIILGLAMAVLLIGCGGGGGGTSSSGTPSPAASKVLGWTPPQAYADQTPLDPAKDLSHYEIHINDTGDFSKSDVTEATVSAIDPANGKLVTSFDLANLGSNLAQNVKYYVSMRSVSNTGVISDFSPAASFSL